MSNLLKTSKSNKNALVASLVRQLSSYNKNNKANKSGIISLVPNDDFIWAENNWSHFGKQFNKFKHFPLPGQIGLTDLSVQKKLVPNTPKYNWNLLCENMNHLLNEPLAQETQMLKIKEATDGLKFEEKMQNPKNPANLNRAQLPVFELKAHNCPKSLLADFSSYFRMNSIADSPMTVVTISFKTNNDMALWNSQVDAEREFLTEKFVETAQEMCQALEQEGFWADFVDPSSGSLHKAPFTHATFYETDERYQKLGFEIIDQGCCKVISHHKWGTRTYVGCVLTNASTNNKFLNRVLDAKF